MPSLKSLLQSLFKLSGSQAMPSGSRVVQEIQSIGEWQVFTAPFNGYFSVSTAQSGGSIDSFEITNETAQLFYRMPSIAPTYVGGSVTCRKGDKLQILLSNPTGSSTYVGNFIRIVGET